MQKHLTVTIISLTFIWAGLVTGISFIEAPLKFQAPGITLELGLGIGKLVFGALTTIEIVLSLIITCLILFLKDKKKYLWLFSIPVIIVMIDNFYLLPILDLRLEMIISGIQTQQSNMHWYYVILEVIKLILLIISGIVTLNHSIK